MNEPPLSGRLSRCRRQRVAAIVHQVHGTFSINPSPFDRSIDRSSRRIPERTITRHTWAYARIWMNLPLPGQRESVRSIGDWPIVSRLRE